MTSDAGSFLDQTLYPDQGPMEIAIYLSARLSGLTKEQAVVLRQEFEADGVMRWGTMYNPLRRDVYASIDVAIEKVRSNERP